MSRPALWQRQAIWRDAGIALAGSAALLGVTALFVGVQSRRAEQRHRPAGRFLELDGVRLHYVDQGEGPAVVLLHGNGSLVQDWRISGLADLLATDHRVIAIDRPGYGHSTRPRGREWTPEAQARLLARAFQQIGIDRPIVVGHSWGALVALALALQDAAQGLVLLSGYYFPSTRADLAIFSTPAVPILGELMRHTVSPLQGRLMSPGIFRKLFQPAPVPPAFAHFPLELALRPSQLRASAEEAALMMPAATRLSARYGELTVPITILAGSDDRIVDGQNQSGRLHATIAHSKFMSVSGAGHMLHHQAQAQILAAIRDIATARSRYEAYGIAQPS